MKIFVLTFLMLSISCGLNNAGCLRDDRGDCKARIFNEPEPREIHYVYRGESCSCPRQHDVIIQEFKEEPKERREKLDIKYGIQAPVEKEEKMTRYLFDVRIEQPIEKKIESSRSGPFNYQLQTPPQLIEPVRYMFDTRIEQPIAPCKEKPWQGLVAQIDTISMPRTCSNSDHTPETCNCGCQNPSHTRKTCNCKANKDLYTIPIIYGDISTPLKRTKRDTEPKKTLKKPKRPEIKFPKLKKIDTKELASILRAEHLKLKLKDPKESNKKSSSIFVSPLKSSTKMQIKESSRLKRKETSPCAYTYESCDPSRKTGSGCPLCYRCRCEPAGDGDNQKFSTKDVKIPYRVARFDEPFAAPTQQEFDFEPASYTGLRQPDMYKQYIQEIISKYPEHMARQMPNMMDQQRDFNKFLSELVRDDKSPQNIPTEDIRYKIVDNVMDLYKFYEQATSKIPKIGRDGKIIKSKRGTVLEMIEMDSEEIKNAGLKMNNDDFSENSSD